MATGSETDIRAGEECLDFDPAEEAEAGLAFIGVIHSPWTDRASCPRNIGRARETGQGAEILIRPAYRRGLAGLAVGRHLMVLAWMHHARRDLIMQAPRHVDGPRGTFALRSPNRPNPITLSCVTITGLDPEAGRIEVDAIDFLDGTPVLDLKPWLPTIDMPAGVGPGVT